MKLQAIPRPIHILVCIVCIVTPLEVMAQSEPELQTKNITLQTIELEKMIVWGEQPELAMRLVKIGFENKRSTDAEDANKLVCWVDKPAGSHMDHLFCGTNGALDEHSRSAQAVFQQLLHATCPKCGGPRTAKSVASRSRVFVSANPVNKLQLEEMFQRLGPSSVNREIVRRAIQGEEMPDNVPTETELEKFLEAYVAVKDIRSEYDSRLARLDGEARESLQAEADAGMAQAIDEAGLTVARYNEISDLSKEYNSLRNYLAEHLARR